ncbi:MAG TPA: hypothetical protein VGH64_13805 [Puia sp.]|jgi:hypothetical protein
MKNNNLLHDVLANISITDYWFFGAYISLVVILAFCLLAAVKIKEIQRRQKAGSGMVKINNRIDPSIGNEPNQKKAV